MPKKDWPSDGVDLGLLAVVGTTDEGITHVQNIGQFDHETTQGKVLQRFTRATDE